MKLLLRLTAVAFFFTLLISCTSSSNDNNSNNGQMANKTFAATLTGAQETPPNASSATGTSTLVYNPNTRVITATTTYSGLSSGVTAGHIHVGAPGVAGPPVVPFTTLASPITVSATLTAAQAADLNAGNYYVNIHSTNFPDGEIRGQYILKPVTGGGGY